MLNRFAINDFNRGSCLECPMDKLEEYIDFLEDELERARNLRKIELPIGFKKTRSNWLELK